MSKLQVKYITTIVSFFLLFMTTTNQSYVNAATEAATNLQSEQEVAKLNDAILYSKKAPTQEPNNWMSNVLKNLKKQEGWNSIPKDNTNKSITNNSSSITKTSSVNKLTVLLKKYANTVDTQPPTWYTNSVDGIK